MVLLALVYCRTGGRAAAVHCFHTVHLACWFQSPLAHTHTHHRYILQGIQYLCMGYSTSIQVYMLDAGIRTSVGSVLC